MSMSWSVSRYGQHRTTRRLWMLLSITAQPLVTLEDGLDKARADLAGLEKAGYFPQKSHRLTLLVDGIKLFADAFDKLLGNVEKKRNSLIGKLSSTRQTLAIPRIFAKRRG